MPSSSNKFYVTTPIYYVNARPHIGHAYTTIVADVLARRHRLLGDDTFFLTGTDEHGQKIERSAAAAGIPPQQFTDEVSQQFRSLWDRMGLTYDRYIRTTDPAHKRGAQKLFTDLYHRGAIYLSSYTGQYSIGEEMFVEGPPGTLGPDGRPTETVTEENFFFRLSDYQRPVLELIETNKLLITPDSARNEVLRFLRGDVPEILSLASEYARDHREDVGILSQEELVQFGLDEGSLALTELKELYVPGAVRDLSVSRSSFTWGIPVPEAIQREANVTGNHIIYVWLDALANYMTAIGYGDPSPEAQAEFNRFWPADLHLVGKEITRFHCVYWPAFLLAAGLPLPKQITANGWLLFDNAKMSKSRGNVVRTETILDAFGDHVYGKQFPDSKKAERDLFAADILRYFLLSEIQFGQDGSFSFQALYERYNAELTNGYGNLVSRALNLILQNNQGLITSPPMETVPSLTKDGNIYHPAGNLRQTAEAAIGFYNQAFDKLNFNATQNQVDITNSNSVVGVLDSAVLLMDSTDEYITINAPWKLAKNDSPEARVLLGEILYTAAESIRIITALLYPILPNATAKVWKQLGLNEAELTTYNAQRTTLHWGGLQPGTKLGPLAPIFPRADKGLAQIMIDMEESRTLAAQPTQGSTTSPLAAEQNPASPAASLRSAQADPVAATAATLPVAGSTAPTATEVASVPPEIPGATGPAKPADAEPEIAIDDFIKVELRVARILVAERIPKADKLLRLEVDLGYEKRQILSGIAQWYTPEELVGRRIAVVANLAPRKMRGLESHGMLLAASAGPDDKPVLASFSDEVALGSRVR